MHLHFLRDIYQLPDQPNLAVFIFRKFGQKIAWTQKKETHSGFV